MLNRHSQLLHGNRLQRSAGMRRRVGPHGGRYVAEEQEDAPEGLDIRRCLIIEEHNADWIGVIEHPDTDGDGNWTTGPVDPASVIPVAKPPALRGAGGIGTGPEFPWVTVIGSAFNGRQTGAAPGTVLQQSIVPPYVNGFDVYVMFGIKNGTGVVVNGEHLTAMDVTPGRQWVDGIHSVCVKIGTKKEQMLVRGSSATVTP